MASTERSISQSEHEDVLKRLSFLEQNAQRNAEDSGKSSIIDAQRLARLEEKFIQITTNDLPHMNLKLDVLTTKMDANNAKIDLLGTEIALIKKSIGRFSFKSFKSAIGFVASVAGIISVAVVVIKIIFFGI